MCTASYAQDTNEIQIANEYLIKGEKDKALTMFESLAKSGENIPAIHDNYLNLMLDLGKVDDRAPHLWCGFVDAIGNLPAGQREHVLIQLAVARPRGRWSGSLWRVGTAFAARLRLGGRLCSRRVG